jgi:hypothetical protein
LRVRICNRVRGPCLTTLRLLSQIPNIWCFKSDRCATTREMDYNIDVCNGSVGTIMHSGCRDEGCQNSLNTYGNQSVVLGRQLALWTLGSEYTSITPPPPKRQKVSGMGAHDWPTWRKLNVVQTLCWL